MAAAGLSVGNVTVGHARHHCHVSQPDTSLSLYFNSYTIHWTGTTRKHQIFPRLCFYTSAGTSVERSAGTSVDRSAGTSVERSAGTSVDTSVDRSAGMPTGIQ